MAVDYDLVIIGGSEAGVYAAIAAAKLRARVALVATDWQVTNAVGNHTLSYLGHLTQQTRRINPLGQHEEVSWQTAVEWSEAVVATLADSVSPARLAALGIDVIQGAGAFHDRPPLTFVVNQRVLRSRAYLLAPRYQPIIPEIPGLQTAGFLDSNWIRSQSAHQSPPGTVVIIGSAPDGIEIAQTLARFGSQVTMVFRSAHLLPKEDPETAFLLQAQLEAEGVRILSQTQVSQVRQFDGKKWVQAGDRAIETDEILLAGGQSPDIASLNLEAVGVQFEQRHLRLNRRLQTTNPRIYACTHLVGSYPFAHVARYETQIALRNALFLPYRQFDPHFLPHTYLTKPELASVGLTEPEARAKFGKEVWVVRQPLCTLSQAQIQAETTGFCKLIIRDNGQILGAHLLGAQTSELIGTIALAMRHRLKIQTLAELPFPSPTYSEILNQVAISWQQQRLVKNERFKDFLEGWFQLRRSWSR
jgi:pyruvate/2-oxoglutarate dehydrogenase complex dihydrolipoamide dehydrogenase (E3) component